MLLTFYSSLFHLCFQHQGQDWRCHQHLKKKVPDIQGQCPKSTSLHHTLCRYFKELLLLTFCKISVFQACKSTFVSTAGPVHLRDTKTRRIHPSKPPKCFLASSRPCGLPSSNQALFKGSCSTPCCTTELCLC